MRKISLLFVFVLLCLVSCAEPEEVLSEQPEEEIEEPTTRTLNPPDGSFNKSEKGGYLYTPTSEQGGYLYTNKEYTFRYTADPYGLQNPWISIGVKSEEEVYFDLKNIVSIANGNDVSIIHTFTSPGSYLVKGNLAYAYGFALKIGEYYQSKNYEVIDKPFDIRFVFLPSIQQSKVYVDTDYTLTASEPDFSNPSFTFSIIDQSNSSRYDYEQLSATKIKFNFNKAGTFKIAAALSGTSGEKVTVINAVYPDISLKRTPTGQMMAGADYTFTATSSNGVLPVLDFNVTDYSGTSVNFLRLSEDKISVNFANVGSYKVSTWIVNSSPCVKKEITVTVACNKCSSYPCLCCWLCDQYSCQCSKWDCGICGYCYTPAQGDLDSGVSPGTAFEDLPVDWVCPLCGMGKEEFIECS